MSKEQEQLFQRVDTKKNKNLSTQKKNYKKVDVLAECGVRRL